MAEWQPINTAPKDGTTFVACRNIGGADAYLLGPYVCRWNREYWLDVNNGVANPTHWMPLPKPPRREVTARTGSANNARALGDESVGG